MYICDETIIIISAAEKSNLADITNVSLKVLSCSWLEKLLMDIDMDF